MKPVSRELDEVIVRGDFPPQQFCDSVGFLQKKKYLKEVPPAFQKKEVRMNYRKSIKIISSIARVQISLRKLRY